MRNYLIGLAGISVVSIVMLFVMSILYPQTGLNLSQSYLVIFFAFITFSIHSLIVKLGDEKQVGLIFIGGVVVKLIFTIMLMLIIKFLDPAHFANKLALLSVLYLLYTLYEVTSLIKVLNK
ncbi:hypothetical protein [Marinigracilibium pacificum]|uniref:Uncharacterized protein n=1 Tax=Marinigracilibium pacificum TaxID=2729599 RepID=A0A848IYT8_9BACT|nr:hypothetical protein [Marinigracilibium pacificum]NMM47159.1 hypothetical protein [Marinigracilibium pacificum]